MPNDLPGTDHLVDTLITSSESGLAHELGARYSGNSEACNIFITEVTTCSVRCSQREGLL